MMFTRRDFGKIALAALPAGKLLAKPDSKYGGVQIGIIISPVTFRDMPLPADEILNNLVQLGISAVEMQDIRVEAYAGAPIGPRPKTPTRMAGSVPNQRPGRRARPTPEQLEERRKQAEELQQWRISAPMDKYRALREMYRKAGVHMYAFRMASYNVNTPEAELAYYFNAAEALGADGITTELPRDPELSKRLGEYAAKRKMMIGYHNHTQVNFHSWDTALAQSKYNGIQFDVGHYMAATSESPIPFIQKYHERITNLHLKDRKSAKNGGQNMPWGEGDTPLKQVLLMMRQDRYKFPAGIELEYHIPQGSSTMAEIGKCLKFCKDALA